MGGAAITDARAATRPAERWQGWFLAVFSTACFSLAPTISKGAIDLGMDALTLLTARLALATVLLGATMLVTAPGRLRIDRRGLSMCLAAGLANGIGMVTFFLSLARLDASVASMIYSLSPLMVLALLALRGEKFTYRNTVRLALGLGGVYLLIGPGGKVDGLGALMAFGAVVTVPIQIMIIQWYLGGYDARTVTFYTVGMMTLVSGAWWLAQGAPWRNPAPAAWLLLGLLVIVSTYVARLMMFAAIRQVGGGQVGLLAPVETMLTVLWSVLFLGERLAPLQWIGSVLILLGALLAVQRLRRVRWPTRDDTVTR